MARWTLEDTRAMFADSGVRVYLGDDVTVDCVHDRAPSESLGVDSIRAAVRITAADADQVAIDSRIVVTDSYTSPPTELAYFVREKQPGHRTVLLILEPTT